MVIRHKISSLMWLLGIVLFAVMALFWRFTENKKTIHHEIESYSEVINDLTEKFEKDLIAKSINTTTISSSIILAEYLRASNKKMMDLTDTRRTESIDSLNDYWKATKDESSSFIRQYTDNTISRYLKQQQKNQPGEFGEIFVTNKYGALIASTARLTTFAHGHKYWWQAAYNFGSGRVFLDDRGFDESVQGYVLGVVVPVRDTNDEIIGIIKANYNIEGSLSSLVNEYQESHKGKLQLVRTSGLVVAEKGVAPLSLSVNDRDKRFLHKHNSDVMAVQIPDTKSMLFTKPISLTLGSTDIGFGGKYETIDHIMGNNGDAWHWLLTVKLSDLVTGTHNDSNNVLFVLLFLLVTILFSNLIGRFISRPLVLLTRDIRSFGKGDFNTRLAITSKDEIGELASAFNEMADKVQISNETNQVTIEKLNEQLHAYTALSESLRESEQRYQELFDQSPIGLALCDMEGKLVSINKKYAEMLGYSVDQLLELTYWDITPAGYEEHEVLVLEQLEEEGCYGPYEKQYIHKDGHLIDVRLHGLIIKKDGERFILSSIEDTTRIKESEQARFELIKQLEQAHKMEAIGTLAGGIAHDFNNILSAILGFAELSLSEVCDNPTLQEYLEDIIHAGNRAKDVVSQILSFSRKSNSEFIPVSITESVTSVLTLLRASTPANIVVKTIIPDEEFMVLGDGTNIHQVVLNLCSNAIQAIGDSLGEVTITLSKELLNNEGSGVNSFVAIEVADTGCGISSEDLEHIFEPYYTTKDKSKGTGLGLAVVSGIVENHHGFISAKSTPSKGSVFTVLLPLLEAFVEHHPVPAEPPQRGHESILVVDDEEQIVRITSKILKDYGYNVTTATSSVDALDAFVADPHSFDLIVSDYSMPELNGVTLAKELRKIRPDIPIVLCTGYSSEVDSSNASDAGFNEFILKPIEYRRLLFSIRTILDSE